MPIAITEDHEELSRAVRRWLDLHCPPEVPRATLDQTTTDLPSVWKELADQGWLGLAVSEADGGQGFGLSELVVVLEEAAYSMAPGPIMPTALVASVLSAFAPTGLGAMFLPGLVDGSTPGAFALHCADVVQGDGATLNGTARPVLCAPGARILLLHLGAERFALVDLDEGASEIRVEPLGSLDTTRPMGSVTFEGYRLPADHIIEGLAADKVRDLARILAAAECAGGARWCLETASTYAKARVQFGRPIGQFQAVKHKLADMLVTVEQIAATAWDAAAAWDTARQEPGSEAEVALAAAVAGTIAFDGFTRCAKECVQILGGIGFTWEHDAHLYLKRASATRQVLGAANALDLEVAASALAGVRRTLRAELPPQAESIRSEIAPLAAEAAKREGAEQRRYLVETGLLSPHWPEPYGRSAGPLEQVVIDQELEAVGVLRPNLGVGAWALPTLIAHGTDDQQERFVGPSLLGELAWCQLFSEPGAGSDLASLSTRATRTDGGWLLNGQKVWTSLAHVAHYGICLARTDPEVPKHQGITYFLVDMKTEGVDIRPLRELTGQAMFNEVFLTDVFVPDDCVVGTPGQGWAIGRTTLANERVSMSSGAAFGIGVEAVLNKVGRLGEAAPPGAQRDLGALLAEAQSLRLMGHRVTLRSLSGMDPGAGASVRKLLGAEHEQRMQEMGLALLGEEGATVEGSAARWTHGFLVTRCLTIAGGTSEVQRNVIAERLLGQPKDPEPGA